MKTLFGCVSVPFSDCNSNRGYILDIIAAIIATGTGVGARVGVHVGCNGVQRGACPRALPPQHQEHLKHDAIEHKLLQILTTPSSF